MSILQARKLSVEFAQRGRTPVTAVDDVSLTLEAGRTLALVGESGSGKSTVVRALAQLVTPNSGEILLHGEPARRRGRGLRAYRRSVQLVFQDPFASLNPAHTVGHQLRRPLLAQRQARRGPELTAAVADLLGSVNLTPAGDIAGKFPHELSGGQRQRVAIARALATAPQVLLADEPVSMLDVSIRLEILGLLDRLRRERRLALLYVTHDLATARHFSSEILVMYRGQIVESGPSDAVILEPRHPYTRLLAAAAPDPGAARATLVAAGRARRHERLRHAAERRETPTGEGCRFRARCEFAMDACARRPPDADVAPGHVVRCWLYEGRG